MNYSGANTRQQPHITETFLQKVLAHLDDADESKLNNFLQLFSGPGANIPMQQQQQGPGAPATGAPATGAPARIVFNGQPSTDPTAFLTLWSQQVVQTQHSLTALDYHVIPGSGTVVCNATAKVRFDESGRDKRGQDAVVASPPGSAGNNNNNNNRSRGNAAHNRQRQFWGPYFGVSLQLVLDERMYRNDMHGVIQALTYTIVYKPEDSLIEL